ncbi:GTP-binding protein Rho3 [Bifiguratus adelaidae]|uniref:GTP-binding protein Rho3 n=1 Tax=Bifiguratus adelaidae TaxID=1938954 RepID=A0A261Y738_9FUNG|nr:GTP-binding protein Rho3 [Bifiguratus adelaidae]
MLACVKLDAKKRKIVILGDGACGKTSLLKVFTQGYFPQVYEPTVFKNYTQAIEVRGTTVELSLWDTAGQEEFDRLRSLAYADSHVAMLCFAVDNRNSLENIEGKWLSEIQVYCPGVILVLVALKCDLRHDPIVKDRLARFGTSPVTYEEGLELAKQLRAARYLECSAKFNRGVQECFQQVAQVALNAKLIRSHENIGSGLCSLL